MPRACVNRTSSLSYISWSSILQLLSHLCLVIIIVDSPSGLQANTELHREIRLKVEVFCHVFRKSTFWISVQTRISVVLLSHSKQTDGEYSS